MDAMGGDHAPAREVGGALDAVRSNDIGVILVGRETAIREELAKHTGVDGLPIDIVHTDEVITMEDSAAKVLRAKRRSSIHVAARLVRDGEAQGFVSAGNTGAAMAIAKTVQGMIHGVDRPALASAFPTVKGKPAVLVDVGANVDCTPRMLAQFAVMGEVYSRVIFHTEAPSVGILSIGEEDHKGNELTRTAHPLLRSLPINFIGNVEGRDLYTGSVDVIVCDGFVGNIALKVSEGLAEVVKLVLRESLTATVTRKLCTALIKPALNDFKRRLDYSETGGAPLLGVKGVCIICHGSSNTNAVKNAVRIAAEFARGQVNRQIEEELHRWNDTHISAEVG